MNLSEVVSALNCCSHTHKGIDICNNCNYFEKYTGLSCWCRLCDDASELLNRTNIYRSESSVDILDVEDYVKVGDVLSCFEGMDLNHPEVFHAVGLIEWAMGKRSISKETLSRQFEFEQPRLLTAEEIKIKYDEPYERFPIYFETKSGYLVCVLKDSNESDNYTGCFVYGYNKYYMRLYTEYNKTWRCWTARPSVERRKAVKWDD